MQRLKAETVNVRRCNVRRNTFNFSRYKICIFDIHVSVKKTRNKLLIDIKSKIDIKE